MKQRGRKSGLSLAAVQSIQAAQPLKAPASLTAEERKVWEDTVNAKPAEWFGVEHIPLLESYCRHVCEARRLGKAINRVSIESLADDNALIRHERLCKMRDREARAASALATRMRLTQQAVYDMRVAGNRGEAHNRAAKPWQRAAA